jgi:hypothetical protein
MPPFDEGCGDWMRQCVPDKSSIRAVKNSSEEASEHASSASCWLRCGRVQGERSLECGLAESRLATGSQIFGVACFAEGTG